jgi:hypothetical protein
VDPALGHDQRIYNPAIAISSATRAAYPRTMDAEKARRGANGGGVHEASRLVRTRRAGGGSEASDSSVNSAGEHALVCTYDVLSARDRARALHLDEAEAAAYGGYCDFAYIDDLARSARERGDVRVPGTGARGAYVMDEHLQYPHSFLQAPQAPQ